MNESLVELFTYILPYHKGFMHGILLLLLVWLGLTFFGTQNKAYALRIRYFLPIYHSFLAAIIFTGFLLLSVFSFVPSLHVVSMILCSVALIGLSAVSFKRLKRCIPSQNFTDYRNFALKSIVISILLVLVVGFV
ncbi:hypothetical protein U5B43_06410 [Campylobacter sp. 9BO]|uniref:hypothetical protein n=1 Tax=Campylobacter sp. 9BO TaxID=3424759 RepID=UPI003D34D1D3